MVVLNVLLDMSVFGSAFINGLTCAKFEHSACRDVYIHITVYVLVILKTGRVSTASKLNGRLLFIGSQHSEYRKKCPLEAQR